ncbi:MAG: DUF2877 domain-containing protein [Candidatus Caldarchaeum sp.]|nr:DUF2877 domain-containing protein [Candidatus Caldarchaeum sp.]
MKFGGLAGCEVNAIFGQRRRVWVEGKGEKAIYLRTEDDDVVIFAEKPLTPYSVSVRNNWEKLKNILHDGLEGAVENSTLLFKNGVGVELTSRRGCEKIIPSETLDKKALRLAYNIYLTIASLSSFDEAVKNGVQAVRSRCITDLARRVIGIGPGLTPSGDDFVSGVLLAHRLCNMPLDAKVFVERAMVYSRWPSWKMMEHAHHGCTFLPVYRLAEALSNREDPVGPLADALRIGASTGLSTVAGFLETLMILT